MQVRDSGRASLKFRKTNKQAKSCPSRTASAEENRSPKWTWNLYFHRKPKPVRTCRKRTCCIKNIKRSSSSRWKMVPDAMVEVVNVFLHFFVGSLITEMFAVSHQWGHLNGSFCGKAWYYKFNFSNRYRAEQSQSFCFFFSQFWLCFSKKKKVSISSRL